MAEQAAYPALEPMWRRRGVYVLTDPPRWAKGCTFGPLQSDGFAYLCPECGGYGYLYDRDATCDFCKGKASIPLDDPRITDKQPRKAHDA